MDHFITHTTTLSSVQNYRLPKAQKSKSQTVAEENEGMGSWSWSTGTIS